MVRTTSRVISRMAARPSYSWSSFLSAGSIRRQGWQPSALKVTKVTMPGSGTLPSSFA